MSFFSQVYHKISWPTSGMCERKFDLIFLNFFKQTLTGFGLVCRGLCDSRQTGKLNVDQFALAMWLINRKLKGVDPPPALTPEMVPPSMRSGKAEITAVSIKFSLT